jgi:hypothetical protein
MTYAMTLDNSWELMTEDEMYDVNGGFYISNGDLINLLITIGINPLGGLLWGIGIYKLGALISSKAALLGAKIGGAIGGVIGALLGLGLVGSMALTMADALIQGKGISVEWKKTFFGMPYWVDISVE